MNELWQIIAELGLELHPDRVAAIASKIESLGSVEQFALVKPVFGPNADKSMIGRLDAAWREANQVRPGELAAALRLSLIHISEPTRLLSISYAVFCLKKKTNPPPTCTSHVHTDNRPDH